MNGKKDKYYAKSVGIDSDYKLFLILPNGKSIYKSRIAFSTQRTI